jgi:hypothetical protein
MGHLPAGLLLQDGCMNEKERERLHELYGLASQEPDSAKMIRLVREIYDLLQAKEQRMSLDSQSAGVVYGGMVIGA